MKILSLLQKKLMLREIHKANPNKYAKGWLFFHMASVPT